MKLLMCQGKGHNLAQHFSYMKFKLAACFRGIKWDSIIGVGEYFRKMVGISPNTSLVFSLYFIAILCPCTSLINKLTNE